LFLSSCFLDGFRADFAQQRNSEENSLRQNRRSRALTLEIPRRILRESGSKYNFMNAMEAKRPGVINRQCRSDAIGRAFVDDHFPGYVGGKIIRDGGAAI